MSEYLQEPFSKLRTKSKTKEKKVKIEKEKSNQKF